MWERITAADRHYEPGKFTAFIGCEWSSLPGGNNLHTDGGRETVHNHSLHLGEPGVLRDARVSKISPRLEGTPGESERRGNSKGFMQ